MPRTAGLLQPDLERSIVRVVVIKHHEDHTPTLLTSLLGAYNCLCRSTRPVTTARLPESIESLA